MNNKQKSVQQRKDALKNRLRLKVASKNGPKKICVTGIMKNESKNVDRLFDSLLPLPPDMISIVDTGSTDDTAEKILAFGKKHNIPTVVHHEPFQDFEYNRTHSIKAAKAAFPEADYFLLTDADFVWEINKNGKFDKTLLIDHKYLIEQYNKALSYWNIRMLSSKVDFSCIGTTHEYWAEDQEQGEYTGEIRVSKIKTLMIDDREDGGCKSDKFERDERLLRKGLADPNPKRPGLKTRYKFYLAQTLKDMGRYEESIEWYNERIKDRGWVEEVYYSKFMIGFNYEQIGWRKKQAVALMAKSDRTDEENAHMAKWNPKNLGPHDLMQESTKHFNDAGVNYLAAYNYRKIRSEALYYLVRMYRLLGMNDMAYNFAIIGSKIKYPDDTLFIERACYDYLFDFEISIVAFYLPDRKDFGRQAISRLIVRDDLPDWVRTTVENNSRQYV